MKITKETIIEKTAQITITAVLMAGFFKMMEKCGEKRKPKEFKKSN